MQLRPALAFCALLGLPLAASAADPQPSTSQVMSEHKQEIQNTLADIDYKRRRIVEANMGLAAGESEAFWRIYNSYRTEVEKLNKGTLAIILDYARAYNAHQGDITDDQAKKLQERVLDLQEDKQELKEKYVERMAKEVSPKRSLRFLQIEDQLDAVALIETSREIPLVE
ncbi:hypothetical protein D3C76_662260 [compost metagenome]|uniref:Transcriptional regulator n=1 Tax=Pseudomonas jinjuensis TaxID=198616 RepID=A0A1H0KF82_9PSED|nr:transcriptional regulator [Pseudomonas jinjuensis]SDO54604.1 hypothetical protein SAMN05216193_112158 [Pseudomonas jinjuensis]